MESNVSRHVLLHVCRTIDKRDREGKVNGTLRERERENIEGRSKEEVMSYIRRIRVTIRNLFLGRKHGSACNKPEL